MIPSNNKKSWPVPLGADLISLLFLNSRRRLVRVLKLQRRFKLKKEILTPKQIWGPPPLATLGCFIVSLNFVVENIRRRLVRVQILHWGFILFSFFLENFKSCLRVPKLWIWVLSGEILKVTLQTCEPENLCSSWWGAKRSVYRAQTREQGPTSAWAEIIWKLQKIFE